MHLLVLVAIALFGCTAAKPNFAEDARAPDGGTDDGAFPDGSPAPDGGSCPQFGFADCNASPAECETYVWADEAHCGDCTTECDSTRLCVAGACRAPVIGEIALGASFSCAQMISGHVLCWGRDHRGELGDGSYSQTGEEDRSDAAAVTMLDDAVAVAANGYTACAIRGAEGVVECWGIASERFVDVERPQSLYWYPVPLRFSDTPERVEQVSLGDNHLCVRTASRVLCSGQNNAHQLGTEDSRASQLLLPFPNLPAGEPRSVAANGSGSGHTCIAMDDGQVYCAGANDDGQCGQDPGTITVYPVSLVPGLADVVQVVAGTGFTCALDRAGAVWCWGDNSSGQLGNGDVGTDPVPTPARVLGLPAIGSLAAGSDYVLAVNVDADEVWGWGGGSSGQLGRGSVDPIGTPDQLDAEPGTLFSVSASASHACILGRRMGVETLRCAGSNRYGELGLPASTLDRTTFTPSMALSP